MIRAAQHRYADQAALTEDYHARGWTDGLPVVAPTPEVIGTFLERHGLGGGDVVGAESTRGVTVTAEQVAINAAMAGCRPVDLPLVLAAVRALLRPEACAHSTTASLAGPAQVVIVNGPIRAELGVASGVGCMGPGFRANATVGRALRLVIRNVLGSIPGELDRAGFSTPGRYSFCFGEDEEASSWTPLHVDRGLAASDSAVTVHSALQQLVLDYRDREPDTLLDRVVELLRADWTLWNPEMGTEVDLIVVFGFEHRSTLSAAGWSKDEVRERLWARLRRTRGPEGESVRLHGPERVLLVAAGGPGLLKSILLPPHVAAAVTEPLTDNERSNDRSPP